MMYSVAGDCFEIVGYVSIGKGAEEHYAIIYFSEIYILKSLNNGV